MTANKRIVLNIVATYGRSLVALFVGLFIPKDRMNLQGDVVGFINASCWT